MSTDSILSFNAGCADFDEVTKAVTPLAGAGKITVTRDPDESYLYFSWEPRDGFKPPADFKSLDTYVLIPGDAQWVHVKQCTTGRVFALKFQSSEKREFFWMQSKTDATDRKPGSLSTMDKKILETFDKLLDEEAMEDADDNDDAPVPATTMIA